MKKRIITIARQYSSGGLKVGKRLAEEMGISCYDSEMFRIVSSGQNMRDKDVAHDDRIKDTSLFDIARERYKDYGEEGLATDMDDILPFRNIYDYQSDIIRSLAEKEPCVLVGRCADYILRDRKDVLRVFIHAPMNFRMRRASSVHALPDEELIAFINKKDEKKASYYHEYTGGNWESAVNYDLSLDTSELGIHGCVDRIIAYLNIAL